MPNTVTRYKTKMDGHGNSRKIAMLHHDVPRPRQIMGKQFMWVIDLVHYGGEGFTVSGYQEGWIEEIEITPRQYQEMKKRAMSTMDWEKLLVEWDINSNGLPADELEKLNGKQVTGILYGSHNQPEQLTGELLIGRDRPWHVYVDGKMAYKESIRPLQ